MIIEYTGPERAQLDKIAQNEAKRIQAIASKLAEGWENDSNSFSYFADLINTASQEFYELHNNFCRKRFAELGGDPEKILQSAKEQVPLIIADIYKYLVKMRKIGLEEPGKNDGRLIPRKDGDGFVIRSSTVLDDIFEELSLHRGALSEDKENLERFYEILIQGIKDSEYTDNEDIEVNLAVFENFQRTPLKKIKTYSILNAKLEKQLVSGRYKEKPTKEISFLAENQDIFRQDIDGQMTFIWGTYLGEKGKKQIMNTMYLTYLGDDTNLTKKLTVFDNAVYNAVSTLYYYNKPTDKGGAVKITPQEIWRTMNGKQSTAEANPTSAQVARVTKSMDKLRLTNIVIDISNELEAGFIKLKDERLVKGRIEGYLIASRRVEFRTEKNKSVIGYKIYEEPILYTYNKAKGQLLCIPFELLDVGRDDEYMAEFKIYLLQEIELMKDGNGDKDGEGKSYKRSRKILLDTLYKLTGVPTPEERAAGTHFNSSGAKQTYIRKTRQADREKIESLLTAWIEKKFIASFTALNKDGEPLKEKQTLKAYEIGLPMEVKKITRKKE